MAVFAPSSLPPLPEEISPNKRADGHQRDGPGHDEKIHQFWGQTAYGW
jgi:hypothetical protein